MSIAFIATSGLIALIHVAVFCWVLAPFPKRKLPVWGSILILLAFAGENYIFNFIYKAHIFFDTTLINCLFSVLFVVLWTKVGKRQAIFLGLAISITYEAMRSAVLIFFLNSIGATIADLESSQLLRISLEIAGTLMALIPLWTIRHYVSELRGRDIPTIYLLGLLQPLIIITVVYIWQLPLIDGKSPVLDFAPILVMTVAELGAVISTVLIVYALATRKRSVELTYLETMIEMQHDQLLANNEFEEAIARVAHDMKNHLGFIRDLKDPDLVEEHIAGIYQDLDTLKPETYTGNATLDIVLNRKAAQARARGIELQVMMEFSLGTQLESVDICAIFGNALDNALSAADKMTDPNQRIVVIKSAPMSGYLVVRISNYYADPLVVQDGVLMSTKRSGQVRGFGLRSIEHSLAKYQGTMETVIKDDYFSLLISIPLSQPTRDK